MKVHFILFQDGRNVNLKDKKYKKCKNNLPIINYVELKNIIVKTIHKLNYNLNYDIHSFDTSNLAVVDEYEYIMNTLNYIGYTHRYSQCFFQTWKPCICKYVLNKIDDNDIIYYVDCSRYHPKGFEYNVSKLIEFLSIHKIYNGIIAGSITKQTNDELIDHSVLDILINNIGIDFRKRYHVIASWFIFTKNDISIRFFNEWVDLTFKRANNYIDIHGNKEPILGVISGLPEQAILSALVFKYKLYCFPGFKNYNDILKNLENNEDLNLQRI